MPWTEYAKVFLLGLAGSGHCIGMCSAFSLAISVQAKSRRRLLLRHLCYQFGKGASYAFVGLLLLAAAGWMAEQAPVFPFQRVIGWCVGGLMVAMGALLVFERRLPVRLTRFSQGSSACRALGALWSSPSLFKSTLVGWVNGFLPCGLSVMALLYLASTGSATGTVLGAFVFTAGTAPSLLAVGWAGQRLGVNPRRWLVRASGVLLVLFGVLTIVRDQDRVHHWMHQHLMPAVSPNHPDASSTPDSGHSAHH